MKHTVKKTLSFDGKTINEVVEGIERRMVEDVQKKTSLEQTTGGSRTRVEPPEVREEDAVAGDQGVTRVSAHCP